MREIKFRVFDKKNKKMLRRGICVGCGVSGLYIINADDRFDDNSPTFIYEKNITNNLKVDDFVIMQYTGLKDENGVEIYEGDIVDYYYYPSKGGLRKNQYQVIFDIGAFKVKNLKTKEIELVERWGYLQVVGNIYENQKLMRGCKYARDEI